MHLDIRRWRDYPLTHAFITCIYKEKFEEICWSSTISCIYNRILIIRARKATTSQMYNMAAVSSSVEKFNMKNNPHQQKKKK